MKDSQRCHSEVVAIYRRRRRSQIAVSVALIVLVIVVPTNGGIATSSWLVLGIFFVGMVFSAFNWRCPNCSFPLGRSWSYQCPSCKVSFRDASELA